MKATFFEKKSRFSVKKRFCWLYAVLMLFLFMGFSACGPEEVDGLKIAPSENADLAEVKSMEPMEGGIATPIIVVGDYFGTDTTKLHVKFINVDDPTDVTRANIIGVNGKMIYFNTPKLTYKDNLKVVVSVEDKNGKKKDIEVGTFKYKTEMTVTTVAGIPFASQGAAYTSGGTLTAATFGCPMFICVDADKNVIIVERAFAKGGGNHIDVGLQPRIDNNGTLQGFGGITSLLNEKTNEVRVLKTSDVVNAPTVSPNGKTVYVPLDVKFGYFSMAVEDGYSVKTRAFAQPASPYNNVDNWKFSFVTDPTDSSKYAPVYTVMYNRELIRIDPLTNASEMLAQDIGTNQSSDTYLAFNPKEDNVLYMSVTNNHSIYRIDLKLDSIFAEPFAGIAIVKPEGLRAPYSGAHDGSYAGGVLRDARFAFPRQITFDDEGVMYIADSWNHCIRSIHVGSSPHGGLTVDRVVGTQGNPGHADGGPEISQLNWPMGIAKAFDGTIYIADTRNYAIRKLVVQ